MTNPFLSALLYEFVHFLSRHEDFFDLKREAREELVQALKIPASFKEYFVEVSSEAFLLDLKMIMALMNGSTLAQLPLKGNMFFKALTDFFTVHFASKVDELSSRFYLLPYETRILEIKKIIEGENRITDALREFLVNNSYQEIAAFLNDLSQAVVDADMVLVQTPRNIDSDFKKGIRKALLERYPHSFPVFQVNRGLIGGFRVFVNGTSHDHSWLSRITKITSLKMVS